MSTWTIEVDNSGYFYAQKANSVDTFVDFDFGYVVQNVLWQGALTIQLSQETRIVALRSLFGSSTRESKIAYGETLGSKK